LSLAEAHSGMITEEYLLDFAAATDEELKDAVDNPDGIMENGVDDAANTSFSIPDYQAAEFSCAEGEMSFTLTYQAVDAAGNTTSKMVHIYLVDTDGKDIDTGEVRFISKEYIDTLDEDSIWRTGEYAVKLNYVLNNSKSGVEYTSPTAAQQALGAVSVAKPGSGTWSHVQEVWEFTHEEVEEIQAYVDAHRGTADPADFLSAYGSNRVL